MLKDELWYQINGKYEGNLCVECTEKRLGIPLCEDDLKRVSKDYIDNFQIVGYKEGMHLPFNLPWLYIKEYLSSHAISVCS